ncbi:MAG: hypothetical protein WBM90_06285 [Acidimicrobiia bacterium]
MSDLSNLEAEGVERLRPVERRILRLLRDGASVEEIAGQMQRSTGHIERVITWMAIPRARGPQRRVPTALQRLVVKRRSRGESYETIGNSLKRSERFVRQVEGHAQFQEGLRLLSSSARQARHQP